MENLVVLNNEKVSEQNGKYFSRNYNFKILPEGLNRYFNVEYIVRKSNISESHKLNLDKVRIASNIIQFVYFVISTFKKRIQNIILFVLHLTHSLHLYFYLFFEKKFIFTL